MQVPDKRQALGPRGEILRASRGSIVHKERAGQKSESDQSEDSQWTAQGAQQL